MDELNETIDNFLAFLDDYCAKLTEYTETIKKLSNEEDNK